MYVSILSQDQLINTVYLTKFQCYRIFNCSFLLRMLMCCKHKKILRGGNLF